MNIKKNTEKCNTNPIGKYIRIALSLFVIGFGLYHKNPIGLLGFMTRIREKVKGIRAKG